MTHPLQASFEDITLNEYVQVSYAPKSCQPRLAELVTTPWLDALLARQKAGREQLDKRGEGAFLVGRFAFIVAVLLAHCQITSGRVPRLSASQLAVAQHGDQIVLQLFSAKILAWQDQSAVRAMIIELLQPMVEHIAVNTKLAPAKQWSLVSDAFASAWQYIGAPLGCDAQARLDVMALLNGERSVLKNRRTGFEEYKLFASASDGQPTIHQYVRTRAGCCRKFTDDGTYCATCVYVPEQERRQRISENLWQQYYAAK